MEQSIAIETESFWRRTRTCRKSSFRCTRLPTLRDWSGFRRFEGSRSLPRTTFIVARGQNLRAAQPGCSRSVSRLSCIGDP
ncbi:unnamed protein product [Musa acuminata subsp. malaccensis]|uniref:(wild Malaysian banana) hypothetical protein n=1 Tax=Musa acuminata subsp. malaccensis TaxID=214687 RepID=A0A8D7ASE9_MUSAM|nr:unnamed protein product [Musa acuminata subsp. malaccensis]